MKIEFEVEAQGSEFLSDGEVGSTDSASESDGENSSQESAKVQKKRHRLCAADHCLGRSRFRSCSGHQARSHSKRSCTQSAPSDRVCSYDSGSDRVKHKKAK